MRTRTLAGLAILAVEIVWAAGPVRAQTYDPSYSVCLDVFGPVGYYECRYSSLPQCAISASGRAANCVVNPYTATPFRSRRSDVAHAIGTLIRRTHGPVALQ
jgi:hypothetical protein